MIRRNDHLTGKALPGAGAVHHIKGFGVQCPNCGRRSSSIKGIGALKITKWVLAALVLLLLFIVAGALLYSH